MLENGDLASDDGIRDITIKPVPLHEGVIGIIWLKSIIFWTVS